MKSYEISYNGFHGRATATIRPISVRGEWGVVSVQTARRLNNLCCGIGDCRCGETLAEDVHGNGVWRVFLGEQVGYYPQAS